MTNQYIVIFGTLISTIGSIGYLVSVLKGEAKPNKVSFLLWSIAPLIAFAAQIKEGVGIESLMTFSTGFLPFLIFIASFINKKSKWKITKFDLICGILSGVGLVLWLITKVGDIAITFSIIADGLAAVPTVVKAFKYPDTEVAWPWLATASGAALTLLAIKGWSFTNSGFIIYIFLVNILVFALVQFRIGKKYL